MTNGTPHEADHLTRGLFITFEGGEGVGKSTHIHFLVKALEDRGYEVLSLREPGGTAIGETLRTVVLDPQNKAMADATELLIYEAARAQLVAEVIEPALARGAIVLCDRFTDSSIAYQAYGRGLPVESVRAANGFATGGLVPDRTLLLVCGVDDGLERATHHAPADRLESAGSDFHRRVNRGFLAIAADEPRRVRVIESTSAKSHTSRLIFHELEDLFPWMADSRLCDEAFFAPLDFPKDHVEGANHGRCL